MSGKLPVELWSCNINSEQFANSLQSVFINKLNIFLKTIHFVVNFYVR